jgi:hypothetical protein
VVVGVVHVVPPAAHQRRRVVSGVLPERVRRGGP